MVKQVRGKQGWNAAIVISDKKKISEMRIIVRPAKRLETKAKLTEKMVSEARQQLLPNAIEKEILTKEISGKEFSLVYFRLTDARSEVGDGKYLVQGIGISSNFVLEYLMLSKAQTAAEQEILDCLAGCIVKRTE